jgi:hypothetical protein
LTVRTRSVIVGELAGGVKGGRTGYDHGAVW